MKTAITCILALTAASAVAQPIGTIGSVAGTDGITYTTIVAKDNYEWIQQNLGATQVATADNDVASYGSLYQWGRWNDGHEVRTPDNKYNGTPTPNDPTGAAAVAGSPFYYHDWWYGGSAWTDTWAGAAPADVTATNGCDPCSKILGGQWHIPNDVEWRNLRDKEGMSTSPTAFSSSLKIPKAGRRNGEAGNNGVIEATGSGSGGTSYFWTNKSCMQATGTSSKGYIVRIGDFSSAYGTSCLERGNGLSIRCIKSKPTAVTNASSANAYVAVYPNPVQNDLFINAGTNEISRVEITDMCGKVVLAQQPAVSEVKLCMAELTGGIYLLRIYTNAGNVTRKVIKE